MPQQTDYHDFEIPVPFDISTEDTNVWGDILNNAFRHLDEEVILRGTASDQPVPEEQGRLFLDENDLRLQYDTGKTWEYVGAQAQFLDSQGHVMTTPKEVDFAGDISVSKTGSNRVRVDVDDSYIRNDGDTMAGVLRMAADIKDDSTGAVIWDASAEHIPETRVEQGSGSGLDADTLDALDSTQFLRSDVNDTWKSGTFTFEGPDDGSGTVTVTPGADTTTTGTPSMTLDITGSDVADGTTTVWDTSAGYVPESSVQQGAGSGLDADTVDAYQASALAVRAENEAIGGSWTFNSRMEIGDDILFTDRDGDGASWVLEENGTSGDFIIRSNSTNVLTADASYNVTLPSGHLYDGGANIVYDQTNNYVPQARVQQGSGSGLDADTVDAYQASALAVRAEAETISGAWDFTTAPTAPNPSAQTEVATKDYVDSTAQSLEYKESVLAEQNAPPGTPSAGDRYLTDHAYFAITAVDTTNYVFTVSGDQSARFDAGEYFEVRGSTGNDGTYSIASVTYDSTNNVTDLAVNETFSNTTADGDILHTDGAWNNHGNELAEYDGSTWVFNAPNEGWSVFIEGSDSLKTYYNNDWILFGSTLNHSNLQNLGNDDHTHYLHRDGRRAMTGNFDAGGNNVTGVSFTETDHLNMTKSAARIHTAGSGTDSLAIRDASVPENKLVVNEQGSVAVKNSPFYVSGDYNVSFNGLTYVGDSSMGAHGNIEFDAGGNISTSGSGSHSLWFWDKSNGYHLMEINEGGPVAVRNSHLQLGQNIEAASGNNLNIVSAGGGSNSIRLFDYANNQSLMTAHEGGPVSVSNTHLDINQFMDLQPISEPAAPSTGKRVFVDSADGGLKVKDTSGAVSTIAE